MIKSYRMIGETIAINQLKDIREIPELGMQEVKTPRGLELYRLLLATYERCCNMSLLSEEHRASHSQQFLQAAIADLYYIENGRRTIQVDSEAAAIISTINIDRVLPETIRPPYPCAAWDLPDEISNGRPIFCAVYARPSVVARLLVPLAAGGPPPVLEGVAGSFPRCVVMSSEDNNSFMDYVYSASSIEQLWRIVTEGEQYDNYTGDPEDEEDIDKVLEFLLKVFVFLQAFPDALKEGPYVEVKITKKGKKGKLTTHTVKKRSLTVVLPEKVKTCKRAHFTQGHYRSLHHPRYARLDDNGNKLPVGEEGVVQVVYVTPHVRGGRVSHVSLDGENK